MNTKVAGVPIVKTTFISHWKNGLHSLCVTTAKSFQTGFHLTKWPIQDFSVPSALSGGGRGGGAAIQRKATLRVNFLNTFSTTKSYNSGKSTGGLGKGIHHYFSIIMCFFHKLENNTYLILILKTTSICSQCFSCSTEVGSKVTPNPIHNCQPVLLPNKNSAHQNCYSALHSIVDPVTRKARNT